MNIGKWYEKRGLQFVIQRASILLNRYGITPVKAIARIEDSLATLEKYGCSPTFFTPGIVVKRYSRFIQSLQAKGAEIAVHSYQHVDLNSMKQKEAEEQLKKAVKVFHNNGIEAHGFRCPYLSCSDELLATLVESGFGYSSNRTIFMDVPNRNHSKNQSVIFNTLRRFYNPTSYAETVNMPWSRPNMIEIPVCVPDDLQLHDGLNLDSKGISQAWIDMLYQTHRRGELFNLIFHPELGSICRQSFEDLLQQAKLLKPSVWIARLHDVSDWWKEKSAFKIEVISNSDGKVLKFSCTPRATILVRGLGSFASNQLWDSAYYRLTTNTLTLPEGALPFVGLHRDAPNQVVAFLKEQGYIIQIGEMASSCNTYLDAAILSRLSNQVQIIDYIEKSHAPLVRFWRWPDGAKSALCITGDLDALSLMDYASRLFIQ